MELLLKYKFTLIAVLAGALAGYIYYAQIGCVSGTCAITSSPVNSSLYGAVLGYLVLGIFKKDDKNDKD